MTTASHTQPVDPSPSTVLEQQFQAGGGQPHGADCACSGIDDNLMPCKPSRRRMFIKRTRKVADGIVETVFHVLKSKRGGEKELSRRSNERHWFNARKRAARRRAEQEMLRESLAEAFA
jgi:hypothetical protein